MFFLLTAATCVEAIPVLLWWTGNAAVISEVTEVPDLNSIRLYAVPALAKFIILAVNLSQSQE